MMSLPKEFTGDYYSEDYFWKASKGYYKQDGTFGTFGYCLEGVEWWAWGILVRWLKENLNITSAYDFGCGTGGFIKACLKENVDASGSDFSEWAITNTCLLEEEKHRVKVLNVTHPLESERKWDIVTGWDLLEHIYESGVDQAITNMKNFSKKWMAFKICTAQHPSEVQTFKKGEPIPRELEWLAVSGHVNSQYPKYWEEKLEDDEWKINWDLSEGMFMDLRLSLDWRTTLIVEKVK